MKKGYCSHENNASRFSHFYRLNCFQPFSSFSIFHDNHRSWSSDVLVHLWIPSGEVRWGVSLLKLGAGCGNFLVSRKCCMRTGLAASSHVLFLTKSMIRKPIYIYQHWFLAALLALVQTNKLYWLHLIVIVTVQWLLKARCVVIRAGTVHKWPLFKAKSCFSSWVLLICVSWKENCVAHADFNLK